MSREERGRKRMNKHLHFRARLDLYFVGRSIFTRIRGRQDFSIIYTSMYLTTSSTSTTPVSDEISNLTPTTPSPSPPPHNPDPHPTQPHTANRPPPAAAPSNPSPFTSYVPPSIGHPSKCRYSYLPFFVPKITLHFQQNLVPQPTVPAIIKTLSASVQTPADEELCKTKRLTSRTRHVRTPPNFMNISSTPSFRTLLAFLAPRGFDLVALLRVQFCGLGAGFAAVGGVAACEAVGFGAAGTAPVGVGVLGVC